MKSTRYARSWASKAQIVRAVLLASATVTTLGAAHRPFGRRLACGEHGAGAVDQEGPQISVPSLGDAKHAYPTSSAFVPRHQAEPGGELAS